MKKICNIKPEDLNCNIFSSYDYDGYSLQDLLCEFYTKIEECINISNNTLELNEWLKEIGLKEEVISKLDQWKEDGTLNKILNEKLFKELDDKISKIDEMAVSADQKIKNNENTLVKLDTRLTEAEKGNMLNKQSIIELKEKESEFERRIAANSEGSTTNANLINELKQKDEDIIEMLNSKANPIGKGIIDNKQDWNNYSADGIYRVDNYIDGPNGPKGSSGYGILKVSNTGANAWSQVYICGTLGLPTETWSRIFHTGHWTSWTKTGAETMVPPEEKPLPPETARPTGRKFLVDAGHSISGEGVGTTGNGMQESVMTRQVKDILVKKMKAAGHTVIDCTVDHAATEKDQLKGIVAKANQHSDAEMFISIHFNSFGSENAYGTECFSYFSTGKAADFSKKLTSNVSKKIGTFNRGAKTANFYVLKNTTMPAVLLETLFLSNKSDVSKYNAEKIAEAIMETL